jgi:hypothetical protein
LTQLSDRYIMVLMVVMIIVIGVGIAQSVYRLGWRWTAVESVFDFLQVKFFFSS